nr:ferric reduction oxidase 2-like [Tanacetum cinerariifolium]
MLLYTFPVLFIAVVASIYLHLKKQSNQNYDEGKKEATNDNLSIWKRPMIIKGLGIVSKIELAFLLMFIALLVWSFVTYLHVSFAKITPKSAAKKGEEVWESKLDSVALRFGLIGNLCLAFLFFPVTRGSSILSLFGLTSEASIKYHIWLGHIVMTLFSSHGVCYILYWIATNQTSEMLKWAKNDISNVAGELALVAGLIMWATTFPRIRRKMFEVFFYAHHMYILFMVFFVFHVGISYASIMLPGFYLFMIDRFLRFLQSKGNKNAMDSKQIQNMEGATPVNSPDSWFYNADRELESVPQQSLFQSTNVHYGERPDLKRMLFEQKESSVGVLVCGPKKMRHEVANICSSGLASNLHFESISFSWTMEEMMIATTAFIREEAAIANKKKGHMGANRFTPLTRTPKEILAAEANKFQPPPPMVTPVEKRNGNKFCDFHNDKGHSTDECMQLKKQIEELLRAGKLSHLIKEIKQGRKQPKTGRKEAAAKDKPTTIYMSLSPYNGIIGRPGLKAIQAVPSTVHGMLKFPTEEGIVTIRSSLLIPAECASVGTSPVTPEEKKAHPANLWVPLHPNFLDQEVMVVVVVRSGRIDRDGYGSEIEMKWDLRI